MPREETTYRGTVTLISGITQNSKKDKYPLVHADDVQVGNNENYRLTDYVDSHDNIINGSGDNSLQHMPLEGEKNFWDNSEITNPYLLGKKLNLIESETSEGEEVVYIKADDNNNVEIGAFGPNSTMWNAKSQASGGKSHAEGSKTIALSNNAHAEGNDTFAGGKHSHAEGSSTAAVGNGAHAEGNKSQALGAATHAEGTMTIAKIQNSHAEGAYTLTEEPKAYKVDGIADVSIDGGQTILSNSIRFIDGTTLISDGIKAGMYLSVFGFDSKGNSAKDRGTISQVIDEATLLIDVNDVNGDGKALFSNGILKANCQVLIDGGKYGDEIFDQTKAGTTFSSHAEGMRTISRLANHAEGIDTEAKGFGSHAEGRYSISEGEYSHAEGYKTLAKGHVSHAEGKSTLASGIDSHAEGVNTKAIGNYSHAEGNDTETQGDNSHAEGQLTKAIGKSSHSEGSGAQAEGVASHAEGNGTLAKGQNTHAEGGSTKAIGANSHAEGCKSESEGVQAHAEGYLAKAIGAQSHAEGNETTASGNQAHAEGTKTTASGTNAHSEGSSTTASGTNAHSEGSGTTASGNQAHAEGSSNIAFGINSHAEGGANKAIGNNSHVEGYKNETNGAQAHAEGYGVKANGSCSHAEGNSTIASGDNQHVQGKFNVADSTKAHIVGGGNSNDDRKNIHTIDWDGNAEFSGEVEATGFKSSGDIKLKGALYGGEGITTKIEKIGEMANTRGPWPDETWYALDKEISIYFKLSEDNNILYQNSKNVTCKILSYVDSNQSVTVNIPKNKVIDRTDYAKEYLKDYGYDGSYYYEFSINGSDYPKLQDFGILDERSGYAIGEIYAEISEGNNKYSIDSEGNSCFTTTTSNYIILNSSTPGSKKQFKLSINDDGELSVSEL